MKKASSCSTILPVYMPGPAAAPRQKLPLGTSAPLVREITPRSPIVPKPIDNLPGVRAALKNRSIAFNHSNQGYNVLAPDGSVRFVTGNDYLPIDEKMRRSQIEGRAARERAMGLTVVSKGMITISQAHETARDMEVAYFGYDFVEPNLRFNAQEQKHTQKSWVYF